MADPKVTVRVASFTELYVEKFVRAEMSINDVVPVHEASGLSNVVNVPLVAVGTTSRVLGGAMRLSAGTQLPVFVATPLAHLATAGRVGAG
jgi:hypothetical protein